MNYCHYLPVASWYIITVMGQQAGHLALGIGKAAAATLTIIPEEYRGRKVVFSELCDVVEAAIIKRRALGKDYGITRVVSSDRTASS